MMDINSLCPGCMRELEKETHKVGRCPYCGYEPNAYKQNARCLPISTVLAGKYLVGKVLGEGGFGITYMGFDLNMESRIAIKEYFPVELVSRDTMSLTGDRVISFSGDKSVTYRQGLEKYVAEAQNVSRFSEVPGVVSVKDFFYGNETAYIVMEYIDGISLKDYLKKSGGRLSEEETLEIMKPVLEALAKVHEAGIIHRDISPDNIMLTFAESGNGGGETGRDVAGFSMDGMEGSRDAQEDGWGEKWKSAKEAGKLVSVRLIDFGAARMAAKNDQKSLTIILKHGYAPEEQYRTHGEQGAWTDVYAVCAVMYRMLTGQTPVPAMDRLFQDGLKSFDELGTVVSRNTASAILKGLAVKKEDRIQGMCELIDALYGGKGIRKDSYRKIFLPAGICVGCLAVLGIIGGTRFWMGHYRGNQGTMLADVGVGAETEMSEEETQFGSAEEKGTEEAVEFETEKLGDTIVFPDAQTSLSIGKGHVLLRMPDGSVKARGANGYGQCMVGGWSDIVAVSAGPRCSLGLRSDGKVFAAGFNGNGECGVDTWENVVQIAAGCDSTNYGLTAEGKVLACGSNEDGHLNEVAEWHDIVAIAAVEYGGVIGLDREGTIHFAGSTEGYDKDGNLRSYRFDEKYVPITGWAGVKYLVFRSDETLWGLMEDGSVMSASLEEFQTETWHKVRQFCVNRPVIGVEESGTVVCLEETGRELQAALGGWEQVQAAGSVYGITDRIYVIGLQEDGTILEYRQAGGNTEIEAMGNLEWIHAIETNGGDNLVGMGRDGELLTYGADKAYLQKLEMLNQTGEVSAAMAADIIGEEAVLLKDGRLLFCPLTGETSYIGEHIIQALDLQRRYHKHLYAFLTEDGHVEIQLAGPDVNDQWLAEEMEAQRQSILGAEEWTEVIQIAGSSWGTFYGLHSDGSVSAANGQWGTKKLEGCQGIVSITGRDGDVLGVKEDGTVEVIAASDYAVMFGRTQVAGWTDIRDISMGESHVAGLREDGTVVAAGSNHEGQCDVEDWEDIVYLVTGRNCTLGITSSGELRMAGNLY